MAPDFALKDQTGKIVKLSQFKGKKEVRATAQSHWKPSRALEVELLEAPKSPPPRH